MVQDPIVSEIRCPVHGFIGLTDLERSIVDTPAFQRLRRIKQLAWTDYVYPGASHSRFEHSLGVMHIATRLFDAVIERSESLLREIYNYNEIGLARDRQIVRLAALLHDVGHPPFSHATEALLPMKDAGSYSLFPGEDRKPEQFEHEDYSVAIIEGPLAGLIEGHISNRRNFKIEASEVSALISGKTNAGSSLFWRDLISGQLDADRMDYLLRDSLHAGVSYGKYDLDRVVSSICAIKRPSEESQEPKIAVMKGGAYSAEALIVARYWMHKQVYFHKTRLACNIHLAEAMKEILSEQPDKSYPRPDSPEQLTEFLKWDDFRVMGIIANGGGGEHGERLMQRNHYRLVCELEDSDLTLSDIGKSRARRESIINELGNRVKKVLNPKSLWYKTKANDDLILVEDDTRRQVGNLSSTSALMKSINIGSQHFIYVDKADADESREIYDNFLRRESQEKRSTPQELPASIDPAPEEPPVEILPVTSQSEVSSPITPSDPSPTSRVNDSASAKPVQRQLIIEKGVKNVG